ncbi:cytochrome b/b6 domain-containing protein [Pseudomonas aeruginosa]|uniref:cytochrome b n=1 Tax=Pseudomonas aeruginosa TaxID=287 RepID=UPI000EAE9877|nr:cytochrome b/b6 domain-containing protein [Pseudomonas aeruginosa]EIU1679388.1 cytochrome b/b6 domain-containing protein [Pseudomonas aeruginosa]EKV4568264.1 cytochrome b/b6 domain-containing protein [Pseudomonas aeruginosa]MCV4155010.1 cytochrome b/b6 domain-containing protein [Pseudomonas aeruginosa]MCV4358612.1 cytochrome b/b6 domain-containing protein [Pseudomonas aeruginosa]MCW3883639.1 cytochrome b/b6 domain-containing protein [Pseudomonas aeruginosa]
MTSDKYTRPRMLLHWCFAAIIIWASISGFVNALLSLPEPIADTIASVNVSLTTLLIPLLGARLFYVMAHPAPEETGHFGQAGRLLAKCVHLALYVSTSVVLLSGVLMMERPIDFFGLLAFPQPLHEPLLTGFFNDIHRYSCMVLAALVTGHVSAVVLHQLRGHPVLRRMLP